MANASLVIGNWKMNGNAALTRSMTAALREQQEPTANVKVVVCPPFTLLGELTRHCYYDNIAVGAQNVNAHNNGAHTGEISLAMLQELGVEYVIVGHSERRAMYAEDNAAIAAKVTAVTAAGLTAVLCVGEDKEQRNNDQTWSVIEQQLSAACNELSRQQASKLVVAYEPVWAIGTGETATPEQAQQVHSKIRGWLKQQFDAVGDETEILYGGSVKADNAAELFAQQDIDGGLIGGASLKEQDFVAIVQAAQG
ncbi:triose-phosphate isomerase [Idiomarina seosinensis]|uniref:Triosephosphate isomerase n=1 Tax=Idiomarina seosinensis TaxID=281739 RepID=A0A432ZH37_9GAMM|nr:triose-phosphate isomerase [Idiomarina seosinensis]RUO77204.1 triose-phosphate isomerase [Idiomarina seosinensis]